MQWYHEIVLVSNSEIVEIFDGFDVLEDSSDRSAKLGNNTCNGNPFLCRICCNGLYKNNLVRWIGRNLPRTGNQKGNFFLLHVAFLFSVMRGCRFLMSGV